MSSNHGERRAPLSEWIADTSEQSAEIARIGSVGCQMAFNGSEGTR